MYFVLHVLAAVVSPSHVFYAVPLRAPFPVLELKEHELREHDEKIPSGHLGVGPRLPFDSQALVHTASAGESV